MKYWLDLEVCIAAIFHSLHAHGEGGDKKGEEKDEKEDEGEVERERGEGKGERGNRRNKGKRYREENSEAKPK